MKSKSKLATIILTLIFGFFFWILTFIGDSIAPLLFIWPAIVFTIIGGISLFLYMKQTKT